MGPEFYPSLCYLHFQVKFVQSRLTLCDPMDYTIHGILQARILDWVAFSFSRGPSQQRDWTQVSCTAGRFFTSWALREAPSLLPDKYKATFNEFG